MKEVVGGKRAGVEGAARVLDERIGLVLEAGSNIRLMKSGVTVSCSGRQNGEDELQSIRKHTVLEKDSEHQEFPLI